MPAGPGLPTMRREKTARRPRPSSLAHMASPSARGAKRRVQAEVAARVVVTFLIDPELTSQGVREHGNGAADVVLKKLMEGVRGAALELVGQLRSEAPALGGCVLSTLVAAKRFSVGVGLGCGVRRHLGGGVEDGELRLHGFRRRRRIVRLLNLD